jgi:hypothetical protein
MVDRGDLPRATHFGRSVRTVGWVSSVQKGRAGDYLAAIDPEVEEQRGALVLHGS